MNKAQQMKQTVRENGLAVTRAEADTLSVVNLTDKCVHLFFDDGSHLFIIAKDFTDLKFEANKGRSR